MSPSLTDSANGGAATVLTSSSPILTLEVDTPCQPQGRGRGGQLEVRGRGRLERDISKIPVPNKALITQCTSLMSDSMPTECMAFTIRQRHARTQFIHM